MYYENIIDLIVLIPTTYIVYFIFLFYIYIYIIGCKNCLRSYVCSFIKNNDEKNNSIKYIAII